MKLFIIKSLFIYCLMLPSLKAAQTISPLENITFYTENYPPANYLEQNELKGITVDTLKEIWQHLNIPEQEILVVPWARGYRFTLDHNNTALFTMSKTPARENLFKWVGPIFHSTHVLMAKKSSNFHFTNLGQIFYHSVAAIEGDISEISLHQIGFPSSNMAKVSQLKQAFLMMQSERVDMMIISIHGFTHLAKQLNFDPNDYQQVWQVNKIGNYLAFNINTPDEVIQAYQQAFDALEQKRLKIKENYTLPLEEY